MFGYVNVKRDELNKAEISRYQSYYCGLCRQLKEVAGIKGQMLLNYDVTFLIVLWSGLYNLETYEHTFSCALHPTKKKIAFFNDATKVAADLNIVLSYHSLMDGYEDEGSRHKLLMAKSLESSYDKICRKMPDKVWAVE